MIALFSFIRQCVNNFGFEENRCFFSTKFASSVRITKYELVILLCVECIKHAYTHTSSTLSVSRFTKIEQKKTK